MVGLTLPTAVAAETEEAGSFFKGLVPEVVHIDSFWVGICLKTKPPVGVPGSETFVDKVPAEPNDWLVSIRVTGLATEAAREMVMAKLIPHFEMYLNEELNKVGSTFAEALTRKSTDDEGNGPRPHAGSRVYTLSTSTEKGAVAMEDMVWRERDTDEAVEVGRDAKERMVYEFARGFRAHLDHDGNNTVSMFDRKFLIDDHLTYSAAGVAWMKLTYANPPSAVVEQ